MEVITITHTEGVWMPLLITANVIGLYAIIVTLLWREGKKEKKED